MGAPPDAAPAPNAVTIDASTRYQTMDGFGAADTWANPMTAAQITAFFDPVNGIGLSLLRIGIDVDGTPLGAGAYPDAIAAHAFGVRVWGAPWSPPAADKSNGSVDNGGTLDTSAYTSWATTLAGFATTFQQKTGFPLYAISAQNEPDFTASYASCLYSPAQMVDFVKVLGPTLAALSPPVKLIAAEPDSWVNFWGSKGYATALVADPAASAAVNILATHDYGHKLDSVPTRPGPPSGVTQPVWETEMSDQTAPDVDIAHGIQVAVRVYAAVTTGGASAWHYWWFINANDDGEGRRVPEPRRLDARRRRDQLRHEPRHDVVHDRGLLRPVAGHAVGHVGHAEPRVAAADPGLRRQLRRHVARADRDHVRRQAVTPDPRGLRSAGRAPDAR